MYPDGRALMEAYCESINNPKYYASFCADGVGTKTRIVFRVGQHIIAGVAGIFKYSCTIKTISCVLNGLVI